MDGGKLTEVNARTESRSDLVSVRGQVMEYTFIPTGIKREMVRFGVDCHWKGQVIGTVRKKTGGHSF